MRAQLLINNQTGNCPKGIARQACPTAARSAVRRGSGRPMQIWKRNSARLNIQTGNQTFARNFSSFRFETNRLASAHPPKNSVGEAAAACLNNNHTGDFKRWRKLWLFGRKKSKTIKQSNARRAQP